MAHDISLETAIEMTSLYRLNMEAVIDPQYRNMDILARCESFDRVALDTLLGQKGCEKIRIYYGMEEDLKVHAILVGVNNQDEDMLPDPSNDFAIMEVAIRCPDECPPASDLNP